MPNYQTRISLETGILMENLRRHYQKRTGSYVSKGECLMLAYRETASNTDWQMNFEKPMPTVEDITTIDSVSKFLNIQITTEVQEGIQKLKLDLPKLIGTHTVTIGVVIREILKAAYIKDTQSSTLKRVEMIFDQTRDELDSSGVVFKINDVIDILGNVEKDILNLLKNDIL